jgi:hypothetical protein
MALSDRALTTVTRMQAVPGMGSVASSVLEPLIEEASAEFVRLVGRDLHYQTDRLEKVAGYGTPRLMLRGALPLVSISQIQRVSGSSSTTVDSSDYEIEDADTGTVRAIGWNWDFTGRYGADIIADPVAGTEEPLYQVTYTGGYVTPEQDANDGALTRNLPFDIERVIVDYVSSLWLGGGRDKSVVAKTTTRGNVSFGASILERVAMEYRLP